MSNASSIQILYGRRICIGIWKRNASIPATWIVAECEVAIVRGKRDREPFARQPRTSAVIPAEGYGRTFSWCKIVY